MATHSINYGRSMYAKVSAVYGKSLFQQSVTSQIEELKAQLASMKVESSSSSQVQHLAAVQQPITPIVAAHCDSCGIYGHLPYSCKGTEKQVAAFQAYRNNQPYYSNYNSSYNQPYQHYNNPPPIAPISAATPTPYVHPNKGAAESSKSNVSEIQELRNLVKGMVRSQEQLVAQVAKNDQEKGNAIKNIENQIAQLAASQAARQPGHLPSQPTTANNVHHAYAISLRSGTSYSSPPMPNDEIEVDDDTSEDELHGAKDRIKGASTEANNDRFSGKPIEIMKRRSDTPKTDRLSGDPAAGTVLNKSDGGSLAGKDMAKGKQQGCGSGIEIKVPFPGRLSRKSPFEVQYAKFKEVLSQLNVTIPFLDLVVQVPSYTKFLKNILNRKHTLAKVESVAFTEECRALRQSNPLPKLSDPGSFSIPCVVGTLDIEKALCDLGASVSILPLSLAMKMGMTQFKATNMTIQMADRSISRPIGILEDVPVRVGKFFIPVDFVVLDIPEDSNIPVILGRPFLHTTGALIDVGKKTLTFKVGGDQLVFKQSNVPRAPMHVELDPASNVKEAVVESAFAINVLSPSHVIGDLVEICPSFSGSEKPNADVADLRNGTTLPRSPPFVELGVKGPVSDISGICKKGNVSKLTGRFGESVKLRPRPPPNEVILSKVQRDKSSHKARVDARVSRIVDIDPGPPILT